MRLFPLSALRGQLHPPPIEPEALESSGDFLISQGYVRAALDLIGHGQEVVYQVEPLEGGYAGVPFSLILPALHFRVQIVELLRRTGGPIGPCVLRRRYLHPGRGIWSICARESDGSLWDPFGGRAEEDDTPAPGADPVPFM